MATAVTLPESGYIRVSILASLLDVSRSTIWRWVKKNNFPEPVKLSAGVTVWKAGDVRSWLDKKASEGA
ncbi:MAG: AlpA family phage regulatory protein [Gammaproteobacteria bacterium]|jgi:prophage regulatory protein|nr:AlpA family phage regulatory protein [Gammaproteobacteria bacterium]MBT6420331.1 AlpA family phage regulatory protein [Gammaproteobacteria bacterium]MBT6576068.1 AlpA family phage regulatory protein [Gammaproteobacteria bacterium]